MTTCDSRMFFMSRAVRLKGRMRSLSISSSSHITCMHIEDYLTVSVTVWFPDCNYSTASNFGIFARNITKRRFDNKALRNLEKFTTE